MANQDLDVNPNVDQWNNGIDPAAELTRILALRRADTEQDSGQEQMREAPHRHIESPFMSEC